VEIPTCRNGTRGCTDARDRHTCDVYVSAKRVEALEQAIEAKRLFDEEQARLAAQALATEERLAWDHYAAAIITKMDADTWELEVAAVGNAADLLLEERRKRFGSSAK